MKLLTKPAPLPCIKQNIKINKNKQNISHNKMNREYSKNKRHWQDDPPSKPSKTNKNIKIKTNNTQQKTSNYNK